MSDQNARDIVGILHGFNASTSWGFFPEVARRLEEAGYHALPIDLGLATPSEEVDLVHETLSNFPERRIHLLGHSRGGAIAQIVARERNRTDERVVVWAGIGTWNRTPIRIRQPYHDDVEMNSARLDITEAARRLRGRVLYLHASADMVVPESEVVALTERSGTTSALTIFQGSTHTFGITHPMKATTGTFEKAMTLTLQFLRV